MSMPTMVLGEKQSALPRSQPGALRGSALSSALMQYFTMFNGIRRSLNVVSSVRWTGLSKVITSEAEQRTESQRRRDARPEDAGAGERRALPVLRPDALASPQERSARPRRQRATSTVRPSAAQACRTSLATASRLVKA